MTEPRKFPGAWSVSAAQRYEECPKAFEFQYLLPKGETEIPIHWRLGSVGHAGLEAAWNLRKATRGHGPMMTEENWAAAKDAMAASWQHERMPSPDDSDGLWDKVHAQVADTLEDLSESWEHIYAVEHKFWIRDGINLVGYGDLLRRTDEETLRIRDWKFKSKMETEAGIRNNLQLTTYAGWAFRTMPWVKRVFVSHYYPPHLTEVEVEVGREEGEAAHWRLKADQEAAKKDKQYLPITGSQCAGCQFHPICPAWQKAEVVDPIYEANKEYM